MKLSALLGAPGSPQRARRTAAWIGGLFIAAIVAATAYDIYRGYHETVRNTGRELDSQARVIAEQTARSLQAVDVILRHFAQHYQRGTLPVQNAADLREYLREQAIGLVQVAGLFVLNTDGTLRATSYGRPDQEAGVNVSGTTTFKTMQSGASPGLFIDFARPSLGDGLWVFPIARRLETASGEFAGVVAGRGRIDYFEEFYRDIRLDEGTGITLMLQDGTLLARHPRSESALGKRFPLFDELLAAHNAGAPGPTRTSSPVDGVERFGALRLVPDFPLAVIATRDTAVALAPWRAQAVQSVTRTAALAGLAVLLLAVVIRQLSRLNVARESLEVSQERFAVAVAGSDDGIFEWDYATGRAFGSARAREILGLPPGPEVQSIEDWFAQLDRQLHPDDAPRRIAAIEAHLAGATPAYEGDFRVKSATGGYRWVHIRGLCVRRGTERPHRMAGSISDIDAAKRAAEALRTSEERFALAVAGSNDGIWDINFAEGRVFISTRALELAGMPAELQSLTLDEWTAALPRYLHPDDVKLRAAAVDAHLSGRTPFYEIEVRHRHPDGAYRWVHVRGLCVRDATGQPLRMTGSISDIDARKGAEEALRQSEERFALAVAGSNDGVVDWDVVNDRMYSSPRAMEIVGIDSAVTLRTRAEWRELVKYHPEDVARMREDLQDFLDGRTELRDGEYRVLLPNGDTRWIRHRNKCVRDASGRPLRVAGSVSDIDARKRAEIERVSLETQLLQAKKLEAIGTLAGGIAHDFNNILAAILGYGEMAQKNAAEGTALRRHIDAAVSAGMRAKSLVERILAFSRSGIGERVPVPVQSVVIEALELVAASLPDHVRLERRLEAGDAAVLGDPTQVHQVVMNLCANGAQAMKAPGTLTVTLDVTEKERSMAATSALAAGRYVRLAVRDTGAGIAESMRERIFDPFFTTKGVGVGTGLGLSLVHGIVTDLGGGIDVESRVGAGSTFTVYVPWHAATGAAPADIEAAPLGNGETILLVDDEETLVRLGEELIAGLGYEPVGFTSSTAALESFRRSPERFSVVLSDEAMPDMTGSELAREIRTLRPDMPVVLMSGFVTPALSARAREIGVRDVLAKPLVERDIARSLAGALSKGRRS